tara:strand:+ start:409 stop:654 length:246 start_codon:yes stop_codon:yes gene_type:complete
MINIIVTFPIIVFIRFYQLVVSPIIGSNCRYLPTCSEYTIGCLKQFGLIKGTFLSFKRIANCHPWGSHGYDPIPNKLGKKQ